MGSRIHMTPTLGALRSTDEAEAMLVGLQRVAELQFRNGVPSVSKALRSGRLRYIRQDPEEHWRTPRELWEFGGGDCEDLATAIAAERTLAGSPSRVKLIRTGPLLLHAIVYDTLTKRHYDPSITGGMGGRG